MNIPNEIIQLSTKMGTFLPSTNKEIRFNCPFCESRGKSKPDDKWHLYIHIKNDRKFGKWICHRCSMAGRTLNDLAKRVKVSLNGTTAPLDLISDVKRILESNTFKDEEPLLQQVELPNGYFRIDTSCDFAIDYCNERGITIEDVEFYELGLATSLRWRIIIPDFSIINNNRVPTFWQGRWYNKLINNDVKYMSIPNGFKSLNLFNHLNVNGNNQIIITEGPISAIIAGRSAICTYGKYVSAYQIQMMNKLECGEFIVALDGDALEEGIALANTLYSLGKKVKYIMFEHGDDPASLGRDNFNYMVKDTPYFNLNELQLCRMIEVLFSK